MRHPQSQASCAAQCPDEELMVAYREGDDAAFAELYGRYSQRVYGFLMSSLRNRAAADDVFQATFLKLHKARAQYDQSFPFAPWLFTVCRSVLVDSVRKTARIQESPNNELVEQAVTEERQRPLDVPDLLVLPVAQRQAVELRYHEELSFEEIARRLETSPSNVRQMVSRAIKKLRTVK